MTAPRLSIKGELTFVSYTGDWPNLCSGRLTCTDEDGTVHTFDGGTDFQSGGHCGFDGEWNEVIESGPWLAHDPRVERVLNENVSHGCCSGCT